MEANHQIESPDSRSRLHAALSYVLAGFSGLILLVLRREDRFVQFHSLQSIAATVVAIALALVLWLLSFFPLLGFLYGMLLRVLQIGLFLLWLYLLWQAYRGRWFRIPYIGDWAHRQVL
jgi:uncharacterized membrane protein